MKITYLAHSGFLAELNICYLIFDYYQGALPELDTEKPVLVFAVLSSDIYRKKIPDGLSFQQVKPHQEYELPCQLK